MIPIQFSHATGFPAKSYNYLFQHLAPHPVTYIPVFGRDRYPDKKSWRGHVPDLIRDIESKHQEPIIGIGHSFGAVLTYWAAQQRPDLFHKIILIDPPFMARRNRMFMFFSKALGITKKMVPIAKNALKRKANFTSKEEAYEYWKPKFLFRNFHPQCFTDYVEHGLTQTEEGYTLVIPSDLEAHYFAGTPIRVGKGNHELPSYLLYPEKGGIINEQILREQKRNFKNMQLRPVKLGGHMFPLEKPEETASLLKKLILKS